MIQKIKNIIEKEEGNKKINKYIYSNINEIDVQELELLSKSIETLNPNILYKDIDLMKSYNLSYKLKSINDDNNFGNKLKNIIKFKQKGFKIIHNIK